MLAPVQEDTLELDQPVVADDPGLSVTLFDGSSLDLTGLSWRELVDLQWEQERAFAQRIKASAKGSVERASAFAQGYDTVCTIVGRRQELEGGDASMGFDPRYIDLVLKVLRESGRSPRSQQVFEIGYGSGSLLGALNQLGIQVAGVEVSASMRARALQDQPALPSERLLVGDFLTIPLDEHQGIYDVVYWNDVLEHLPTDETQDFLQRILTLLRPGGSLITVTPNWHMRPSDVTDDFLPHRSEAQGFHLKEYTLREMFELLQAAGFDRVRVPLWTSPWGIVLFGSGLARAKRCCEPLLERVPYRVAQKLCRLFSLSITIARKPV